MASVQQVLHNSHTLDNGLEVRFPVSTSWFSRLLRIHKILKYPRVSHCNLQVSGVVTDVSLNHGLRQGTLEEWEENTKEEYIVSLPDLSLQDLLRVYGYIDQLESLPLCHTFITQALGTTEVYKSILSKRIRHPIDLLWVLVEDYNGYLRKSIRK